METSRNIAAASVETTGANWTSLFWLAHALTGEDDAAILSLLNAIDCQGATRRKVIQAACLSLASEIKTASLEIFDEESECRQWEGWGAAATDAPIDVETLREALSKMNPFLRFVWVLRFAEGNSRDETARLLGVCEALVDRAASKAAVDLTWRLRSGGSVQ